MEQALVYHTMCDPKNESPLTNYWSWYMMNIHVYYNLNWSFKLMRYGLEKIPVWKKILLKKVYAKWKKNLKFPYSFE